MSQPATRFQTKRIPLMSNSTATSIEAAALSKLEYRVCPPDGDDFAARDRQDALRQAKRLAKKIGRLVFINVFDNELDEDLPSGFEVYPDGKVVQG